MTKYNGVNPVLIEYTLSEILPQYNKNESGHGIKHIEYVLRRSFKLAQQLDKLKPDIIYTVAIYHDVAHHVDKKRHEILSAEAFMKDSFMSSYFSDEDRAIIKEAIEDHRASASTAPRSDYGKIVSSADRSTDPVEFLVRTHSYTMKHLDPKTDEEIIDRAYEHASEKYGVDGYAQHYLKDEEYDAFLKNIRDLLKSKEDFTEYYKKITGI